jgi:hypothetical protein
MALATLQTNLVSAFRALAANGTQRGGGVLH